MGDPQRWAGTAQGSTGYTQTISGTKQAETLNSIMAATADIHGECHKMVNEILTRLGVPFAEPAATLPSGPGMFGMAMQLRTAEIELRDALKAVLGAL